LIVAFFRLQQDMEYVRTIWRLRDRHVKDAGREVQHMQKALTKMNVQLANVIRQLTLCAPANAGMRREADALPGEPADSNTGS
jgi:hypothetical protein